MALRTTTGVQDAISTSIPVVRLDDRRAEAVIATLLQAQRELTISGADAP